MLADEPGGITGIDLDASSDEDGTAAPTTGVGSGRGGGVQARVASETPPYHRLHRLASPGLAYPSQPQCVPQMIPLRLLWTRVE